MPRRYLITGRGPPPLAALTGRRLALALEEELERPTFTELIKMQDMKLQQLKELMFGGLGLIHTRLQVEQPVPLSMLVDPSVNSALPISTHFNDHQQSAVTELDHSIEDDGDIDFLKAEDFLQLETPIDARRDHSVLKLAYTIPACTFMSRLLRKYPVNRKRLAFIQRRPHMGKSSQLSNGSNRKGDSKDMAVSCQVCGQRFTRQHLFQRHILTHPDPENKIFLCQICGKRFNRADHLNRHSLLHQVSVFKCQQCGEEFDRASHLDRHRRKVHPPAGQLPTQTPPCTPQGNLPPMAGGDGSFMTPTTPQQPSGSNLHLLASVATPESVPGTPILGEAGSLENQFVDLVDSEEEVIQSAPGPHPPPPPIPPQAQQQQQQQEKPEPERPFLCTVCKHRFIRATHLRRHMRIHTGEKPFTCHICGQRYARGDYLRAHIQAHRRDRIHKCKHCGEAFHDLTRFADHCRVVHRDVNDEFGNPCPPPEYSPPPPTPSVTLESTLAFEAAEEITMIPMSEVSQRHPHLMTHSAPNNALYQPIAIQTSLGDVVANHAPSPPPPDMIQMTLVNIPEPSPPSPGTIVTSRIHPAHSSHYHTLSNNDIVTMPTIQSFHNGNERVLSNRAPELVTMATTKPLPALYDANDPILQYIIANGNVATPMSGQSQRLHH